LIERVSLPRLFIIPVEAAGLRLFFPSDATRCCRGSSLERFWCQGGGRRCCILMPTRCHRHQETISKKYSAHTATTPFFSVSHDECQHVPDYFINSRNKCQHVISHKRRFQQFRQDNHRSHAATLILKICISKVFLSFRGIIFGEKIPVKEFYTRSLKNLLIAFP
jgi:hypothetical protein